MKRFSLALLVLTFISSAHAETDSLLDQMISPVSNPVVFEDPRPISEIRPIYMYHKMPSDFVTGSGDVRLLAAQVRYAVNDRLAVIATKDGYIRLNSDKNLDDSTGSANLAAGLKYALVRDDEEGSILTAGLRYEIPTGDPDVFQGIGDGSIETFLSGAQKVGDFNLMGATQLRFALDDDFSSFWDVSFHADYPIDNFYPLVELNMVDVIDAGNNIGLAGEGFDLVNFGSSGSEGKTTVTAAVGARYRVCEGFDLGIAYEFALTDHDDIFDWRLTTDAIIRF